MFSFLLEGHDGPLNDIDGFLEFMLPDDQRRGQSDDVPMGGLGQESVVPKAQANLPGIIVCKCGKQSNLLTCKVEQIEC